jgi:predicted ATPase
MTVPEKSIVALSGIPGAGKSTLSRLLAQRFTRAVHLEAELLQRLIVSGGLWPDAEPVEEAMRQLRLRGRNVALLADSFFGAGFTVVIDDVIVGSRLGELQADLRSRPLYFALLLPDLAAVRERNASRPEKDVFDTWKHLDRVAREETPPIGLRLDTSAQSPEESVAELFRRIWMEGQLE